MISQSPARAAKADIYYPKDFGTMKKAQGAVIFAHAFVQPSYNYLSVIRQLQDAGWVVVAPVTDLFDVIGRDVGVKIDQKRADVKLQSTLQVRGCALRVAGHELMSLAPWVTPYDKSS